MSLWHDKRRSSKLTDEERRTLQAWVRATTSEQRLVLRAQIVLAADRGETTTAIAARLGVIPVTVSKWRTRFAHDRLLGLQDSARSGKPAQYTVATERRVLTQLDQPPPAGYVQWTGPLLAAALGDVSDDHVWRVLRRHGIDLQGIRVVRKALTPSLAPKPRTLWACTWPARRGGGPVCGREAEHSGPGTSPGMAATTQWQGDYRAQSRVQAPRYDQLVCRIRGRHRAWCRRAMPTANDAASSCNS